MRRRMRTKPSNWRGKIRSSDELRAAVYDIRGFEESCGERDEFLAGRALFTELLGCKLHIKTPGLRQDGVRPPHRRDLAGRRHGRRGRGAQLEEPDPGPVGHERQHHEVATAGQAEIDFRFDTRVLHQAFDRGRGARGIVGDESAALELTARMSQSTPSRASVMRTNSTSSPLSSR